MQFQGAANAEGKVTFQEACTLRAIPPPNLANLANVIVLMKNTKATEQLLYLLQKLNRSQQQAIERTKDSENSRQREEILGWLSNVRQWDRVQEVNGRTKGTGQWLLQHPDYLRWLEQKRPAYLWLRGKSEEVPYRRGLILTAPVGSGKSTLTAMVLEDLESRGRLSHDSPPPLFFFCDRTSRSQDLKSVATIYCSLLKQLLRKTDVDLPERLLQDYKWKRSDGGLSAETALAMLHDTISKHDAIIILDAFDECPVSVRMAIVSDLIVPLLKIQQSVVKVFISCRPGQEFEQYAQFNATVNAPESFLMEVQNDQDIELFVHDSINQISQLVDFLDPAELEAAAQTLGDRADGM